MIEIPWVYDANALVQCKNTKANIYVQQKYNINFTT